jgi:galactokinase/galacturonokinase
MALIDPAFEESIKKKMTDEYTCAFPALKEKFSIHICHSADGVKLS